MRREEAETTLEDRGGPGRPGLAQGRGDDAALRRPAGMQELRLRAIDPALQQAGCEAARDTCGIVHLLPAEAEQMPGQPGRAEGRKEAGRMIAAAVELAGGDAADPAGNLVADRDGRDQIGAAHRLRLGQGKSRGDRRAAHMHDGFVVRVVELERLGECSIGKGGPWHCRCIAATVDAAGTRRVQRQHGLADRLPERRAEPGQDQAEHVEHPERRLFDDILRQVAEPNAGNPARKLVGTGRRRRLDHRHPRVPWAFRLERDSGIRPEHRTGRQGQRRFI